MAIAITPSGQTHAIGTNIKGELGLGDTEIRNQFTRIGDLANKELENIAIGKSGFAVAIGNLWKQMPRLQD